MLSSYNVTHPFILHPHCHPILWETTDSTGSWADEWLVGWMATTNPNLVIIMGSEIYSAVTHVPSAKFLLDSRQAIHLWPNQTSSSKGRIGNIMATILVRVGTVSRNREMWAVKKWEQLIFWRDAAGCEMNSSLLLSIGENSMSLPFYPGFVSVLVVLQCEQKGGWKEGWMTRRRAI